MSSNTKDVFLDWQSIGSGAKTTADAIRVLKRYAARRYPNAALRLLVTELGAEQPTSWQPEQNLSEGPDGFYFALRTLKGDLPS